MQPLPTLRGRRVVLSPLRDADADLLFRWINDRSLVELSSPFTPVAWEDHVRWLRAVREADDVAAFGLREPTDGRLVGSSQLVGIDRVRRSAELRIRIGEAVARGRGLGTEAVELLARFGHEDLGLDRVWLEVFTTNLPAIRAYEKAGFVREGERRGAAVIRGRPQDVLVMTHGRSA
jgi:RimJ/RimL family protein N-acetyltransferase